MGIGVVIHNNSGKVKAALSNKFVIRNNNGEVKSNFSNKITGFFLKMSKAKVLGSTLVWARIAANKFSYLELDALTVVGNLINGSFGHSRKKVGD